MPRYQLQMAQLPSACLLVFCFVVECMHSVPAVGWLLGIREPIVTLHFQPTLNPGPVTILPTEDPGSQSFGIHLHAREEGRR
jgi:hypothetical protein